MYLKFIYKIIKIYFILRQNETLKLIQINEELCFDEYALILILRLRFTLTLTLSFNIKN